MNDYISKISKEQISSLQKLIGTDISSINLKKCYLSLDINKKAEYYSGYEDFQLIFKVGNKGFYLDVNFAKLPSEIFDLNLTEVDISNSKAEYRRHTKGEKMNYSKVASMDWDKFHFSISYGSKLNKIKIYNYKCSGEFKGEKYLMNYVFALKFICSENQKIYFFWDDVPKKYELVFNNSEYAEGKIFYQYEDSEIPMKDLIIEIS